MSPVIAIDANGARAAICLSDASLIGPVTTCLPLGWAPRSPSEDDVRYGLALDGSAYAVSIGDRVVGRYEPLDTALAVLRSHLLAHALENAEGRIFIHAGCVEHHGVAILIPGTQNSGKSTLVAALVRAGAVYYTDDYAPLDADGLVYPYPLPLWLVDEERGLGSAHPVESLGGRAGEQPVAVGVVARLVWRGGHADIRHATQSEGVLMLLQNVVSHDLRPQLALAAARGAATGALVLDGQRGSADEAAADLLDLAERHVASGLSRTAPRPARAARRGTPGAPPRQA